ncbi:MAG: hypothetical protein IJF59_04475, partial [Clostridia bacterium]|nr:hypothetical protein [Clostridia bacterium]
LSRTTVTLSFDSVPYNGLHQKPAVASITYNGHTFKEIVSFVSQGDYYIPLNLLPTTNPGSYSIAIKSSGSYLTGNVNAPYTITKATPDVDAGTLSFTYGDMFSGPSALTWNAPGNPTPLTLNEGTDYTYTSPTGRVGDVGTRTGTIAFAGDLYSGTDSFSYSVSPKEITADNISLTNADFVYNGADQLPAFDVKVKLGDDAADTTLVSGTDYTVTLTRGGQPVSEVKDAGTYTVVVSGVNNYTGSVSYTCRVDRLPLADGDAMLSSDQLAWTGDPCSPTIAVRKVLAGGALTVLAEGADYEVQWLKGADAASAVPVAEEQLTDLGDYFALITGIGNYQSSIAVPFRIVRANTAGSGADSYLGEAAEDEFVFGQTITIRLSPESDGTVAALTSRLLRSLAEPVSGDDTMTLYLGSVQLTQPVSPDANGVYTASVSTLHSAVTDAVTQLPATITLTASFSGNSRLAGRTFDLPVTITPAPLTVPQVEGVNRGYREGNRTVRISAVTLSGMLAPYDDVQADIASLEADVDSDQIGVYTKAHFDLSAPIALKGEHSGYYHVPALQFTADTNVMIFGPPVIIDPTEPVEKKAYNNHSAALSVTAEGEELSYQWYKVENGVETPLADGEEYAGVTSPTLRINRVEPRSTTQYICRVTNDAGSDEAQFTVIALTAPPTGDKANPAMWLMLLAVSLIGLCTLRRRAVKA